MVKKTIITSLILIVLGAIILVYSGINSTADECNDCAPIPSTPGDTDYCSISQNNPESKPIIQASSGQIGAGGTISLHIKTGSLSQPPYSWSVSNTTKYTLNKNTTLSNPEAITMTSASGTCSNGYNDSNVYVTVTVTDNCGSVASIEIRNTAGGWAYVTTIWANYYPCNGCYENWMACPPEVHLDNGKYRIVPLNMSDVCSYACPLLPKTIVYDGHSFTSDSTNTCKRILGWQVYVWKC
jgi:hypothetical protein